jgi:hypothetical protein
MDRTGAGSPNDRRMYPFLFAFRNSAVLKSWLFLATGQLHESCLHVFYRLDAAEAEMVHRKLLKTSGPIYKTLKTAVLFPVAGILFVGMSVKCGRASTENDGRGVNFRLVRLSLEMKPRHPMPGIYFPSQGG